MVSAPPAATVGTDAARVTPELSAGLSQHWDETPLTASKAGELKERAWDPRCDPSHSLRSMGGPEVTAQGQQRTDEQGEELILT